MTANKLMQVVESGTHDRNAVTTKQVYVCVKRLYSK